MVTQANDATPIVLQQAESQYLTPQKLISSCHNQETKLLHYVDHTDDNDFADLQASASAQRGSHAIDPSSKLFICVAWCNTEEL